MELDLNITIILIVSGIIVGAINTLAGGGSIVTVTMFTALGLPITIANGTNRIAVFLQNFTSTITFLRKGVFNLKHGFMLSIPVIIGNVVGSLVASNIDDRIFKICFGVILVIILLYLIFDSRIKIKEGHNIDIKPYHYLWFLLIGFYGGYIYVGIGYLI
ncbi:MAG: sulfite exporter TauE/SafE family protein, partial [Alistipes sp.]|nr:sulfite exporter TauE/SafE family protein [Alistipes sp.]